MLEINVMNNFSDEKIWQQLAQNDENVLQQLEQNDAKCPFFQ
jgi:hypothetical protein